MSEKFYNRCHAKALLARTETTIMYSQQSFATFILCMILGVVISIINVLFVYLKIFFMFGKFILLQSLIISTENELKKHKYIQILYADAFSINNN
jgi:hypothetical protein